MCKRLLIYIVAMVVSVMSSLGTTLDQAKEMYQAGDYVGALPVFQEYLKKKPKDASLNHWYGVCLMQTGQLSEAKSYLEFAHKRKVAQSPRYLAEIAFFEYRVDDADEYLNAYRDAMKRARKEVPEEVETLADRVSKMRTMLDRVEQVEIIDSIAVDTDTFFKAYKLAIESGSLNDVAVLPESFVSAQPTVVYMPESKSMMLWAEPDENENYVLVSSSLLGDGDWEKPRELGGNLNEGGDANFPYLMSDGITLYYANSGENSIGGYDIFISRREESEFLQPQNIGMPYNSPYDDYMLVIDEITGVGWWATDRNRIEGKVTIYKFKPKDMRVNYPVEDPQLVSLAKIERYQDTWAENADYSDLLMAIEEIETNRKEEHRDFEFALSGGRIYTLWTDFKSAEARELMREYLSAKATHEQNVAQLATLRQQYASGKLETSAEIETLEKEIRKEYQQLKQLANEVRRMEN